MKTPLFNLSSTDCESPLRASLQSRIPNTQYPTSSRASTPCLLFSFSLFLLLAACTAAPPSLNTPTPPPLPATKTPFILPPSWTPEPPTETPVPVSPTPRPTYTPFQTNTPGPTLPPTPTTFPPVRIASASDHPLTAYNLLFLQTGILRQWDTNGVVHDLITLNGTDDRIDRVQLFDISSGGALVALLRRNDTGQTEIVLYDHAAASIRWTQMINANNVTHLKLSPGNLWVAYAGSGTVAQPGALGVIPVGAPDQATNLAECDLSCVGLIWKPDGGQLIWSDETGIWQLDPALGTDQTPEQLIEPPLQALSASGERLTGTYRLGSFSPSGRYLLLSAGPFPETIPSVFDTLTLKVGDVPGTFLYTDPGSSITWLTDDTLAIGRAGLSAGERPAIENWLVAPETESFLVRDSSSFVGNSPAQAPFLLTQLADTGVRFVLLDFSTPNYTPGNGVYFYDPVDGDLLQLNHLPFLRIEQANWTPNGNGVLFLTVRKTYFVPVNGGGIYEMDAFLGAGACCFSWIP